MLSFRMPGETLETSTHFLSFFCPLGDSSEKGSYKNKGRGINFALPVTAANVKTSPCQPTIPRSWRKTELEEELHVGSSKERFAIEAVLEPSNLPVI